ncbi:MAG: 3'-5' exonuclease [Deltaproteobacteria bacterium]|nr:3'-5' exonuclease [Deltaproteobacteria bacterium]
MSPGCLVFLDTETTGLPKVRGASPFAPRLWPRLVQVGWALYTTGGELISEEAYVIRPEGFRIPRSVSRIHGITDRRAREEGRPLAEALDRLTEASRTGGTWISHNASFDRGVLIAEMVRSGRSRPEIERVLPARRWICTVKAAERLTDTGRTPRLGLADLHLRLFGERPAEGHSALADVRTCARCFFRMREMGVVK